MHSVFMYSVLCVCIHWLGGFLMKNMCLNNVSMSFRTTGLNELLSKFH